jgi:glycosyltransferase involved in cell wall biosynthesis
MRVLGAFQENAAGYYRIAAPFSVLQYRTEHEFCVASPTADDAADYDVLWLQQHADATSEVVARSFKEAGKAVVYDVDDWIFGMPASWPAYGNYFLRGQAMGTERLWFHQRLIALADVVTVTTDLLAEKLCQWLDLPAERMRVLPNCVLQGDWDTVIPAQHALGVPVLGWFGSENHWDDWTEIVDAVDEALAAVDGRLALIGAPELLTMFPARLAERTRVHPLVTMRDFGPVRRLISTFDLGLAWCTARFTAHRCRSPLKALQYGAAGVPVVASRTVYGDLPGWENEGGNGDDDREPWPAGAVATPMGVLVDSAEDLEGAIIAALERLPEMYQRAVAWQGQVWRAHAYETAALKWLAVAEEAAGKENA